MIIVDFLGKLCIIEKNARFCDVACIWYHVIIMPEEGLE